MDPGALTSSLAITYVGHATVLLEMDGVRLLTDPLLRRRVGVLIRRGPPPPPAASRDLDAVLVSHAHLDHLDLPSLRLIDRRTPVVAPRGLGALLRRLGFTPLEMEAGGEVEIDGRAPSGDEVRASLTDKDGPPPAVAGAGAARVRIRAVPAAHSGRRHPFAGGSPALGFVVEGGLSVYFAGDTGLFEEMGDVGPVDVAVLPVGGWGPRLPDDHLGPVTAAEALRLLRPAACVPVHWGAMYPPWLPPRLNARWSQWPHAFARHAARLAPEVEVRVLRPGETTVFGRAEGAEAGSGGVGLGEVRAGAAGEETPR